MSDPWVTECVCGAAESLREEVADLRAERDGLREIVHRQDRERDDLRARLELRDSELRDKTMQADVRAEMLALLEQAVDAIETADDAGDHCDTVRDIRTFLAGGGAR